MNMMTDIPTLLASATVPCPHCDGGRKRVEGTDQRVLCLTCNGEGRVPLFGDEVRVKCWPWEEGGRLHCHNFSHEQPCRGWTAATDGWEEQTTSVTLWKSEIGYWSGTVFIRESVMRQQVGSIGQRDRCLTFREALMLGIKRAVEQTEGVVL